ncbi:carcinoembryonic antigen-related cell adhesion molecule 5-like isoform X3 [Mytilus californianus]|uniref:carcinoembryonic antigen-related cell adhesion molecule 5-like isoform X2 n=1 Tax=Mytilus californianus TaxID=6549 RepID=UPI0022455A67|nr:carcinoembryonic antigen-related cell adhesion molecule 5-like isoform X2 [Mytilus californianus]XP_052062631.1 carcinoembryonic antigen-related cell adhesion molecule 5-like isoform X3 [Mytilus californianus]
MICVTLSTLIACIITGHVLCIKLLVSPDYILGGTELALNCSLDNNFSDPWVTFHKDATLIGFIRNCSENGMTSCSLTTKCHCDLNTSTYIWNYTPSSENVIDATFNCTMGNSQSDRITVKKAELSGITISPAIPVFRVTENATVHNFTCTALCWPECSFKWTGPNNFINNDDKLRLSNIKKSSSGKYQCQATNVVGTNYSNFMEIKVQHSPNNISLFPSITYYTKEEGDSLNVTCSALCEPACNFEWTYPNNTKHNSSILQIESLQRTNDGKYTCRAFNYFGHKTSALTVTINFGPREILLSPSNSNYSKKEGDSLGSIMCTADCNPACRFEWTYPDGTKRNGASLVLSYLQKNHDGIYKCKGFNDVGYKEKIVTVTVDYDPGNSIFFSPSSTSYTKLEGESLWNITCSADCKPSCTFEWTYQDGTKYPGSTLMIGRLNRTQDGVYKCKGYNLIGYSEKTITVTVNYPPESIRLSPTNSPFIVREYTTVRVICTADCRPTCSYQWTGQNTWSSANKDLTLTSIRRTSTDTYTCRARNIINPSYRYAEASVSIIVHTLPTKITKLTLDCTGSSTVSIAWIPDLTVLPTQNYTIHYRTNSKSGQTRGVSNSTNQQNIYLIHIENLTPLTNYMFKISSGNYLGRAESEEVSCKTFASEAVDSQVNGALIGGISLIILALLVFAVIITLMLLYRFGDTHSQSCIHKCFTKILRSSKGKEGIYENTQPTSEYSNPGFDGSEGKIDSNVAAKDNCENAYEPLQRGKQNTTLPLPVVKPADLRKPLNPQYVNIDGMTKKTNPEEKIALRPIVKPKPKRNT